MIDSSAKTDPGLYQFGITNVGKEDQCLRINYADEKIKGSYSMLSIALPKGQIHNLPMNQPIPYGYEMLGNLDIILGYGKVIITICHPHTCSVTDISNLIDRYFHHRIDFTIKNTNRSLKRSMSTFQAMSLFCIGFLLIFTLASTMKYNIPIFRNIPVGNPHFDIIRNIGTVIRRYKYSDNKSSDTDFLNGWKVIYFIVAIITHIMIIIEKSQINLNVKLIYCDISMTNLAKYLSSNVLFGICFNIGTTALVSVVTIIPLAEMAKISNIKLFLLSTLGRYLRFVPLVAFSIMIIIIAPLITMKNTGIFHENVMEIMSNTCSDYGLYDLFFSSNYLHGAQMCSPIFWLLSADFQLSIITFPLFITLINDTRKGVKLASIYVIFGIMIEYFVYIYKNQAIIPQFHKMSSYETVHISHCWTTNYITSYAIALTLGTIMYRGIKNQYFIRYNSLIQSLTFAFLVILTIYTREIDEWMINDSIKYFIGSLIRTINFSIASILIYSMWLSEKPGFLKRLFTMHPFMNSIAKIILPSFICHFWILIWSASLTYSEAIEFNYLFLISKAILVFPLSIIGGYILHIMIELPFMKLIKSILMKSKPS